jgi:uncharacterized protein
MLTRLQVRVTPDARKDAVVVSTSDEIRIKLRAPATEGKANAALLDFLSEITGAPRSKITIRFGGKARVKVVEIEGPSAQEILSRIKTKIEESPNTGRNER